MSRFVRILTAASAALLLLPASAWAVVQLDVRGLFNADVVVNDGSGTMDPVQDAIDLGVIAQGNYCFPTVSVAVRLFALTPDGLPDDGFFPADAYHPDVQLAVSNADDGLNARRNSAAPDTFTIGVPPVPYREIHVFMTGGDGNADVTATLAYLDGTIAQQVLLVPDWFDDPLPTADVYYLVNGRDRMQPGTGPGVPFGFEDRDDAAIFGFRLIADPARTLTDVRLQRTDSTGVLDFFGAVGVEGTTPGLYESTAAPGLLDPANLVATGVSSPFDWAPAPGRVLHYFVDDGTGTPRLIFVSKSAPGLRFTF